MKIKFNEIEKEVVYLKAIKGMIDEMVNFRIFEIRGDHSDAEIYFHESVHQRFFNIMLVDFLSCADKKIVGERIPYLSALSRITNNPNFNQNNSIDNLRNTVADFKKWLEHEFIKNIWLSSIELDIDLHIKRIEFIKICGNISKHNFSRLSGVVSDIKKIFIRNKKTLTEKEILISLDNFYEWFHDDLFNYHGGTVMEFLNNISWGIFEYLQPEYYNSIITTSNNPYKYTIPEGLQDEFARTCYWDILNDVRRGQYVPKFQATKRLKLRY